MVLRAISACLVVALAAAPAIAQLPADAIDLALVKISEKQKSTDLCPVYLVASDPSGPTWEHKGVSYRGSKPDAKDKFMADPEKFAAAAAKKRWENNFVASMSTIWCPVTDEVNPGGGKLWLVNFVGKGDEATANLVEEKTALDASGVVFESCCKFCDEDYSVDDFPPALDSLMERANESYQLTKGKYVEGASSPVEGAIRNPGLDGLVGKWDIKIDSDKLSENLITFVEDDGELAGVISGKLGDVEVIDAEASDDGFFFVMARTINGKKVEAEFEGEQDGLEISGVIYVTIGDEDLEIEFTGKKQHDHEAGHDHGDHDDDKEHSHDEDHE